MSDTASQPDEAAIDGARRRDRTRRLTHAAGVLIGVGLVAGAIFHLTRDPDALSRGLSALRSPSPLVLAGLAAGVLLNLVVTGLIFTILMRRFGRVGLIEMQGLIASATLINYLPLRPGLLGRAAYHRLVNQIPVRHTAFAVVAAMTLSIAAAAMMLTSIGLARWTGLSAAVPLSLFLLLVALGGASRTSRSACLAMVLRLIDVLVWSARYVLAFGLIGREIDFDTALALACVSTVASMVPLLSNGLGLREWAVGYVAPLMVVGVASPEAMLADLVHRAIEVLVTMVFGAAGLVGLAPVLRRARRATETTPSPRDRAS